MKVNLVLHDPIPTGETGSKIFMTKLTHPKLDGELSFYHGKNNRSETLDAITNNLMDDVNEAMVLAKELMKGKQNKE